ncbi:carboxymuconolactone decarboxylase family protein [Puniceicoccus vermicola]|uniref:Carboxymuconolactone decarboxylase family protein n=1 Tax=Puniceicoccus vermicola TaxID=388746 RepID=A0A7X1E464_9BACT|nr:carboxymuconolactone decarboxylase family protein [Puniceicoccus vermicola]MBC2600292.1 carboxymuconolactone decarboxylase family protein [Puniceicoccus vermicola]
MSDRYERGLKVMREHLGKAADEYVENIREVSPLFAKVNVEFAFGDIYGDKSNVLEPKIQELITLSALTVMGDCLPQLELHIHCALNEGATKEEIAETITQMIAYCGFPSATNAILTAKKVFKERGILE